MSKSNKEQAASGGIGLGGLICVILLIAKLFFHADITWFWVFAPLWLPIAIVFGVIALAAAGALFIMALAVIFDRK